MPVCVCLTRKILKTEAQIHKDQHTTYPNTRSAGLQSFQRVGTSVLSVSEMRSAWLASGAPHSPFSPWERMLFWACAMHCQPLEFPFLYLTSLLLQFHPTKQALFWLDVWITQPRFAVFFFFTGHPGALRSCTLAFSTSSRDFFFLWRAAERAGGRDRRG